MSKRQSLKGKGIDSLLFGISEKDKELEKEKVKAEKPKTEVKKLRTKVKKINIFDYERITVPLRIEQVDKLSKIERTIMKSRSRKSKKQRITKNTIIRACLDAFFDVDFDVKEIKDENELKDRILNVIKS